jgi:hypothetical protein
MHEHTRKRLDRLEAEIGSCQKGSAEVLRILCGDNDELLNRCIRTDNSIGHRRPGEAWTDFEDRECDLALTTRPALSPAPAILVFLP